MHSYSLTAEDGPTRRPKCAECGRTTTTKRRMRTDPRNYHAEYRLLCEPCGRQLGFGSDELMARRALSDL